MCDCTDTCSLLNETALIQLLVNWSNCPSLNYCLVFVAENYNTFVTVFAFKCDFLFSFSLQ